MEKSRPSWWHVGKKSKKIVVRLVDWKGSYIHDDVRKGRARRVQKAYRMAWNIDPC